LSPALPPQGDAELDQRHLFFAYRYRASLLREIGYAHIRGVVVLTFHIALEAVFPFLRYAKRVFRQLAEFPFTLPMVALASPLLAPPLYLLVSPSSSALASSPN
jgi:hypothetical protein